MQFVPSGMNKLMGVSSYLLPLALYNICCCFLNNRYLIYKHRVYLKIKPYLKLRLCFKPRLIIDSIKVDKSLSTFILNHNTLRLLISADYYLYSKSINYPFLNLIFYYEIS